MVLSIRDLEELIDRVIELENEVRQNREDGIRRQEQYMAHVKHDEDAFKHNALLLTTVMDSLRDSNNKLDALVLKTQTMMELVKIYEDAKGTGRTFKRVRAVVIFFVGVPIIGTIIMAGYTWLKDGTADLYEVIINEVSK
jgi:hypothetical protein